MPLSNEGQISLSDFMMRCCAVKVENNKWIFLHFFPGLGLTNQFAVAREMFKGETFACGNLSRGVFFSVRFQLLSAALSSRRYPMIGVNTKAVLCFAVCYASRTNSHPILFLNKVVTHEVSILFAGAQGIVLSCFEQPFDNLGCNRKMNLRFVDDYSCLFHVFDLSSSLSSPHPAPLINFF